MFVSSVLIYLFCIGALILKQYMLHCIQAHLCVLIFILRLIHISFVLSSKSCMGMYSNMHCISAWHTSYTPIHTSYKSIHTIQANTYQYIRNTIKYKFEPNTFMGLKYVVVEGPVFVCICMYRTNRHVFGMYLLVFVYIRGPQRPKGLIAKQRAHTSTAVVHQWNEPRVRDLFPR
jgi:hypothetical protein